MGLIFALFLICAAAAAVYVDMTRTPGYDSTLFSLSSLTGYTPPTPPASAAPPAPVQAPPVNDDRAV